MAFISTSRVPSLLKWFYPSWYVWDKKTDRKTIYLTFDDGPIPEVTEFVLDTLARKSDSNNTSSKDQKPIPATFFCIGDNVRKHSAIFKRIIAEGHALGNHTYNHLKGTKTENENYNKNTHLADIEMSIHLNTTADHLSTNLFRPPYGKIKRAQAKLLKKLGYKIIMYRVIAYDWESSVTPEQCLSNVISNARDGDIIVFHDSLKAFDNIKYALPRTIDYFQKNGFGFGRL